MTENKASNTIHPPSASASGPASEPASAPTSAYLAQGGVIFLSTALTRGPWNPLHQHAGPPIALVCRAIEMAAAEHGLTHIARLTANLLRPVPIAELTVAVVADYVGKTAGHFSASLLHAGKELARFTALAQREVDQNLPTGLPGRPPPAAAPAASTPAQFPFADGKPGYAELVEIREARGKNFQGPCTVWFRLKHPLLQGEPTSPYQRVAVAADSGNGISAVLDYRRGDVFVNSDLTINLLRRPEGEWICLEAQTWLGASGSGLAESSLFDELGLIGRATQSLSVRVASRS
jgi:hypothetical protein